MELAAELLDNMALLLFLPEISVAKAKHGLAPWLDTLELSSSCTEAPVR